MFQYFILTQGKINQEVKLNKRKKLNKHLSMCFSSPGYAYICYWLGKSHRQINKSETITNKNFYFHFGK